MGEGEIILVTFRSFYLTADIIGSLILIGGFLLLSAFFSSSEAAFLSFQRSRLSYLVNSNVPGAELISSMITNMERLLATILLGNNLVNVAFTAVITALSVSIFGEGATSILIATAIGTILLLIFGEIIPKSVAVRKSEKISFLYAKPLKAVEFCLYPVVLFLQWLSNTTQTLIGNDEDKDESVTEGEILSMIDLGEAEGTVEPGEAEMLENVFRFSDRQAKEVMTPRTEIVSIDKSSQLADFLEIYSIHSHTRFPVHKDSSDNIIGLISAKDILRILSSKGMRLQDPISDIIRDAYFVPETKLASELFEELRNSGNQLAICLDEYGGIAGLVTLKRLTESVVGRVGEEGESPEEEYENIRPNVFQIEGGMDIGEANDEMKLNLPTGGYETIAGFVLAQLGEIPEIGQEFEFKDLLFKIVEMDRFRIESILITKKLNPLTTNGSSISIETKGSNETNIT